MNRLTLALNAFLEIVHSKQFAAKAEKLYLAEVTGEGQAAEPHAPPKAAEGARDALALLALLQREGRLVDFLEESIDQYTDAQVGAAVRDIHRACKATVERVFGPSPVSPAAEGGEIRLAPGYSPEEYRLVGNVTSGAPPRGRLRHHGWRATRYELPQWHGSAQAQEVIAPAEVEVT